ncbi:ABC transporter substrate-binding protein [Aestuariivirga litoralis]|uniref:ABC transporter substrate-binding protein n=1 Tax=Aestuariivirga litoralis TaxID=2650924 RepID=UPI0018C57254|nr:ABC transporter substrate-binding protein [Aestuariivirga litoralis]MBG1232510.1 ABC transporter substrate-binding protein [Aestuariivirga litoralis]
MLQHLKSKRLRKTLAALACATAMLASSVAQSADKLTYFTWSGYEPPEFSPGYDKLHPEGFDAPTFGDDDDAFTKVKAGFHPDIAHPCYDKIARWNKEGLLQPIETAKIKNWDKIFPVFRNLPDLQAGDGKVWFVPWDWGNTSILYRTDLVKNPEASWNLLWNKDYAGKMATIDAVHDTPVVAALLSGVSPFDMDQAGMDKVAAKLREQRPLMSTYTTDMTSVEQNLASGALVAAMTWNASAVALKKQGVPVEFMKPKEGMLTWVCGFVMMKDTKKVDAAYDFINSRLEPEAGAKLINDYGYGASTSSAFASVKKEDLEKLQLPADPDVMLKSTIFTGPMKQSDELAKMFEKVKAGG